MLEKMNVMICLLVHCETVLRAGLKTSSRNSLERDDQNFTSF